MIEAWTDALHMDGIGVHDNFFELGGDSLQATILLNHLQEHLGQTIPGHTLFRVQCVHDLAAYLRERCPAAVRARFPDELADDGDPDGLTIQRPATQACTLWARMMEWAPSRFRRLSRDRDAEDLLARIDELEDDEVEALLGSTATNGEVRHE